MREIKIETEGKKMGKPQFRLSLQLSILSSLILDMEARRPILAESAGRCMRVCILQGLGATNVTASSTLLDIIVNSSSNISPHSKALNFVTIVIRFAI